MARRKPRRSFRDLDFSRPRFNISDETKQSISAVVLILLGVVSFLSLIDLAGAVGIFLNRYILLLLFGALRWLAPFILVAIGYVLLRPSKYALSVSNYLGLGLFALSFTGLIHLLSHAETLVESAGLGQGGGYLGLAFSLLFFKLFGFWAGLLLLLALTLIGIFLLFNLSFSDLGVLLGNIGFFKTLFSEKLQNRRVEKARRQRELEFEQNGGVASAEPAETAFSSREVEIEQAGVGDNQTALDDQPRDNAESVALSEGVKKFKQIKIDMPLDLLSNRTGKPSGGDLEANKIIIQKTLNHFGIQCEMSDAQVGPTVTQYTLKPAEGVRLSKITALNDNLALALAAHPIRIEAPIPGRSLVGIEVPNAAKAIVPLRATLDSESFHKRTTNLLIALGVDVMGRPWLADLKKMPHLLIAGSTGSGKSVCINSVIVSLLFQNGPGMLKFIMVDPKRVELPQYNGIPHLLTPVITDTKKTINALRWSITEMERRFEVLSQAHKRNLEAYNESMPEKIPYIVFIIDELADLMASAGPEVEAAIVRLAQMARAVGIHLVLATQRPSVDVLTGLIKANITSRVAFSVASLVDSRTILDMAGAEKLLGRGDMLYISAELGKPKRLQGAFASDEDIKNVIDHLKNQAEPEYVDEVTEKQQSAGFSGMSSDSSDDGDDLLPEAREVILQAKKASASLLQRRLRVGYARAARLLDLLEQQGFIGPADGAKPRELLMGGRPHDTIKHHPIAQVADRMDDNDSSNSQYQLPADDEFAPEQESEQEYQDDEEILPESEDDSDQNEEESDQPNDSSYRE